MQRNFKISFYVNSHADKLFEKRKRVVYFIIVGIIVRRDSECETMVKGNDSDGWSFDDVVLWLGRKNRDAIK
jgi:hypothetical protein